MERGFVCWACAQDAVPEKRDKERAVIEAAKAWAAVYDAECLHYKWQPERGDREEVLLWRTVEALREVEGD